MDWHAVDLSRLFDSVRERGPAKDARRTIRAFEHALELARRDPELLGYLLVACACLVAHEEGETPRTVLEQRFRRAVGDADWRETYAPLFD